VVINGKSLDPHWHCLFTDGGMWYHWDGWFSSPTSAAIFAHPIVKGRNHRTKVEVFTQDQILTLATMGFKYLGEPIGIGTDLRNVEPACLVTKLKPGEDEECAVDYGPEPEGMAWPLKPGIPPQQKVNGARLGPITLETTLTLDNAKAGLTIRHCTDTPDKTTTLRRIRGAWSFENSAGTQCELPESHMCDWRIVLVPEDPDLVAPIVDISAVKVITTATLFRTPTGTTLLGTMVELDHIQVINGDDRNLPKYLRPDQYTIAT